AVRADDGALPGTPAALSRREPYDRRRRALGECDLAVDELDGLGVEGVAVHRAVEGVEAGSHPLEQPGREVGDGDVLLVVLHVVAAGDRAHERRLAAPPVTVELRGRLRPGALEAAPHG